MVWFRKFTSSPRIFAVLSVVMALLLLDQLSTTRRNVGAEDDTRTLQGPRAENADSGGAPADSAAKLEQSVESLRLELAKLRADISRIEAAARSAGDSELKRTITELTEMYYPNPAPLYQDELPQRRLPVPQSLARRRQGTKSWSTLKRPGGDIERKPAKLSKGEMIDAYFRTNGGRAVMTEVVNALHRLDEDIRFSQNGAQLSVRTTRAGQEVVRQLIHYYEEQMNAAE